MRAAHVRQITRTHFDAIADSGKLNHIAFCQPSLRMFKKYVATLSPLRFANIDLKGKIPADH